MLHVHPAASGAALVPALGDLLAQPAGTRSPPRWRRSPPGASSAGWAQRLSSRLGAAGREDGVCARIAFPSPDEVLDAPVAAASPQHAAAAEAWQVERVVWPLLEVLDACPAGERWCAGLRAHLGLDGPVLVPGGVAAQKVRRLPAGGNSPADRRAPRPGARAAR